MIPVSKDTGFKIEKVLRKNRNKAKSLVSFIGLPESFSQWIDTADVNSNKLFKPLKQYVDDGNQASTE